MILLIQSPYQTFCWWKFYSYHRMLNDTALQDIALLMIKSTLYFTYNISSLLFIGSAGEDDNEKWPFYRECSTKNEYNKSKLNLLSCERL